MKLKNKKQAKKPNILELSDPQRVIIMKEAKEQFKQTITEAKLWQSLLQVENLAVNGNIVYDDKQMLNGLRLKDLM